MVRSGMSFHADGGEFHDWLFLALAEQRFGRADAAAAAAAKARAALARAVQASSMPAAVWEKAEVDTSLALSDALPLDTARVVAEGTDVTLLAYGPMVKVATDAAAAAAGDGRSIEVVDLRSLSPLDVATVAASVGRTGRCVIVHEAPVYAGLGAEIAARVFWSSAMKSGSRCTHHEAVLRGTPAFSAAWVMDDPFTRPATATD